MNETEFVSFDFYGIEILGVIGDEIVITGNSNYYDNKCIIYIDRKLYSETFDKYLDRKAEFCKRYGHFCGVSSITSEDFTKIGFSNENIVYRINNIDEIDMEHG